MTQEHLTLVARNASARMAFTMAISFVVRISPELLLRDNSRRSHTHGTNRNRIALHVMLNGRRNSIRC